MRVTTHTSCILLAGASAIALTVAAPVAAAQEETETRRVMTPVVVTTQKKSESIQDVPIAVSAFDEEALENLQLAGGPDLVKSIPNVSFTKGNFTASNFKIRGIGADVVATSGDAGVGVHQNDVPLTSSRLFEAEFYDVERVEALRGPQGTLYGRNATGGVINVITAKPILGEFQADAKLTYGSDNTFKAKGMINIPLGETAAFRLAGSRLTRDGFATNTVTGNTIDDRDLYSIRGTLAWEPTERLRGWLMLEHFSEDDNRARSIKQLCAKDPFRTSFAGVPITGADVLVTSLGCQDAPLDQSFGRVNSAATLQGGLAIVAGLLNGDVYTDPLNPNLREIESAFDPIYRADQTLFSAKLEYDLTDSLLLTALFSDNDASVLSIEDYNKIVTTTPFNTAGVPLGNPALAPLYTALFPGGVVNDPQLGASNLLATADLSGNTTKQTTYEFRLQSDFDGPFNFNVGMISVDFEANRPRENVIDGYYVFSNSLTALTMLNNAIGGVVFNGNVPIDTGGNLIDLSLDGNGGNYFRTISPYTLDSFATFGEAYFEATDTLKLTGGLRYTSDKKEQEIINTFLFTPQAPGADPLQPQPVAGNSPDDGGDGTLNAEFEEVTGRAGFDWSPDLDFSQDTLIYGFYSRGYKGGGINPPQPAGANLFPRQFDPEFINSYEIGTKNTLAGGALQLNATAFYYDYTGYQITQIINRSSVNLNIDAKLSGFELETQWNPVSTLLFTANIGLLNSEIQDEWGIDVLDRGNGRADLVTIKNASTFSNCVISAQGYATLLGAIAGGAAPNGSTRGLCNGALAAAFGGLANLEAAFGLAGVTVTYIDSNGVTQTATALEAFDGEAKSLRGNSIPGAPESTISIGAEYTWEALRDSPWDLTARGDFYAQGSSFSRVWNTQRDQLDSWTNLNLSVRLANTQSNWAVELFGKNITNEEVITGAYLTDDSTGLFTNIFLTEPSTYGVSISKSW